MPGVTRGILEALQKNSKFKKKFEVQKKFNLKKKLFLLTPGYSSLPSKNVSHFGQAVWPAKANINKNIQINERIALLYRLSPNEDTRPTKLNAVVQTVLPTGLPMNMSVQTVLPTGLPVNVSVQIVLPTGLPVNVS